ncbi:hypothetical protein VKT23_019335 [Stygiomarasmius scandens]|uniref:Mob1/phocein n=1 Tax=Marasmiellus scandens TaxID=2682957 RepID=A0ABR1IQL7_9AGAR
MSTTTVIQRPLRGSRISSFYPIKSLPSLSSLDSAFQLQEYISLLIRLDVHDVEAIVSIPGTGSGKGKSPEGAALSEEKEKANETSAEGSEGAEKEKKNDVVTVDEPCWVYEQLRRLAQDLSHPLVTMLQQECTRTTCPEMKAGEWLYLCVAHGNDGAMEQCCAIDYILHTIDSATALLNSPRAFPSRLQIPQTSHRHFSSLARRLGRIFAHAYFHHREAFEQAEAESSLYARFLALTSKFDLVPQEFLVIPPRVVGAGDDDDRRGARGRQGQGTGDVSPPKLMAAGLGPSSSSELGTTLDPPTNTSSLDLSALQPDNRAKSTSPGPGSGGESPRKMGRNRTDTMVFSDAHSFVEELARASSGAGPKSEPEPAQKSSSVVEPTDSETEKIEEPTPEVEVEAPAPVSETTSHEEEAITEEPLAPSEPEVPTVSVDEETPADPDPSPSESTPDMEPQPAVVEETPSALEIEVEAPEVSEDAQSEQTTEEPSASQEATAIPESEPESASESAVPAEDKKPEEPEMIVETEDVKEEDKETDPAPESTESQSEEQPQIKDDEASGDVEPETNVPAVEEEDKKEEKEEKDEQPATPAPVSESTETSSSEIAGIDEKKDEKEDGA